MKRLIKVLPALLLLAACSQPAPKGNNQPACNPPANQANEQPANNQADQPEPEPEPNPQAKLGKLEPENSPAQVRAINLIEFVTGMKFKRKIPVYTYTPEELAEEVKGWGDEGFTPEHILGFYKPSTKCLYMVPDAAGEKRQFGLRIHEATHGLQDQLYDLAKLHDMPTTSDEADALTAMIEGEADQVMIDALSDEQPNVKYITMYGALDMVKLPPKPDKPLTEERLRKVFYYSDGARFMQSLKKVDGYKAVDKAFKDLPTTSEQILHAEKYTGEREGADRIGLDMKALAGAMPKGWKLGEPDTAGELGLLIALALHGDAKSSADAVTGWGGDVNLAATKGDQSASLWVTTWDTAKDAKEFYDALSDMDDVRKAVCEQPGVSRTVFVIRGGRQLADKELDRIITALGKAKVTYHDAK